MRQIFDQKWVEQNAECAAGMSWGLEYVRAGGKDLAAALAGFDRADWLFWFCAKVGLLGREPGCLAHQLVAENLPAEFKEARQLHTVDDCRKVRREAATEAFTAASLGKLREAHAFEAVGFCSLMARARAENDRAKELLYAQAALLSLAGAIAGHKTAGEPAQLAHGQLCERIRAAAARQGAKI